MSRRAVLQLAGVLSVALAAGAPSAGAADLWKETGRSLTSVTYWQGVTFDAGTRTFNFDGPAQGLWRTDVMLARLAGRNTGIPSTVTSTEGWNHLGDLTVDAAARPRPRLLVPLECYYPSASDPNTCHTGGLGVIDPVTLEWRYYVKLDPAPITKAMWVEASPDGRWVWTSSDTDLLAYDATEIRAERGGPGGTPLTAAKRFVRVLRSPNVSGAAFLGDRLYLAFDRGSYVQVLSYPVDPTTGDVGTAWRLEIQRTKSWSLYETEGLAVADALGGTLHWQIQPQSRLYASILHFTPAG